MIVAVEGPVGAGKSTLVRLLGGWSPVEAEYSHRGQARSGAEQWGVQLEYLREERRRRARIEPEGTTGPRRDTVLDRSIVSQAAHVSALAALGQVDNRLRLADHLHRNSRDVVEPDVFVHVRVPDEVRRARLLDREGGPGRAGTDPVFLRPEYDESFSAFVATFMDQMARQDRAVEVTGFAADDALWARDLLASLRGRGSGASRRSTTVEMLAGMLGRRPPDRESRA